MKITNYNGQYLDPETQSLIIKRGEKFRIIQRDKWFINKNTPPGDDAELYELKPHGGKALFHSDSIVGIIEETGLPKKKIFSFFD